MKCRYLCVILSAVFTCLAFASSALSETPPKFALLVGVGDYADKNGIQLVRDLKGPANDLRRLRDLLVENYGFADRDVVILKDAEATYSNIAKAFESHLIASAKAHPGATVLFYFSGHGSQETDLDADEGDGMDETLLPHERGIDDAAFILDDEIRAWVDQLAQYTDNIALIVDSCNSGTVARNTATDTARWVPPSGEPASVRARNKHAGQGLLPRDRAYTLLTAAAPHQAAWEGKVTSSSEIHGYFTYYLVSELRQFGNLTYGEARRKAAEAMQAVTDQDPQVEGDADRAFLGGPTDRRQPSLAVQSVTESGRLRIETGAEIGLRRGALLSVFREAPGVGETRLGMAVVEAVAPGVSLARRLGGVPPPLGQGARVRVVSTVSGLERRPVALSEVVGHIPDPVRKALLSALEESQLVRPAAVSEPSGLVLRLGCPLRHETDRDDGCTAAYYLAAPKSFVPLYGQSVQLDAPPAEVAAAVRRVAETATRQEKVRSLDSQGLERLPGIDLQIVLLDVIDNDGVQKIVGRRTVEEDGTVTVGVGQNFQFLVTNDSPYSIRFAIVGIFASGKIRVFAPEQTGTLLAPDRSVTTGFVLTASPPAGLDSFKLIATTSARTNFSVLEQRGLGAGAKSGLSALSLLFNNVVSDFGARDADVSEVVDARWATDVIDLEVVTQGLPHVFPIDEPGNTGMNLLDRNQPRTFGGGV